MGGSSATPGDLRRKHEKPTRAEREAERFSRLALIRSELDVCHRCVEFWAVRPDYNRLRVDQAARAISHAIAQEDEPWLRKELTAMIEEPMVWFAMTARIYGKHPRSTRAFHQVHRGWRMAYANERGRRTLP